MRGKLIPRWDEKKGLSLATAGDLSLCFVLQDKLYSVFNTTPCDAFVIWRLDTVRRL